MSTHLIVNSQIHCNLFKVSPASCSTTTRRYRTRICGIVNAHPTLYAWCFVLLFTSNLDIISLSFISALHFQVKYNNKDKVIFHFVFSSSSFASFLFCLTLLLHILLLAWLSLLCYCMLCIMHIWSLFTPFTHITTIGYKKNEANLYTPFEISPIPSKPDKAKQNAYTIIYHYIIVPIPFILLTFSRIKNTFFCQ